MDVGWIVEAGDVLARPVSWLTRQSVIAMPGPLSPTCVHCVSHVGGVACSGAANLPEPLWVAGGRIGKAGMPERSADAPIVGDYPRIVTTPFKLLFIAVF